MQMFVFFLAADPHAHPNQIQSVTVRVVVVVLPNYIVLETRDMNPHPHLDLPKTRIFRVGNDIDLPKMHWPYYIGEQGPTWFILKV